MDNITSSVGKNGVNTPADVALIQQLLNYNAIPGVTVPLIVNGIVDNITSSRIETFQKLVALFNTSDGRVDPNGRTFNKLINVRANAKAANTFSFSNIGIDLLKKIEGRVLKPYDDQNGNEITNWVNGATIGYGHLILHSEWDTYKDGITDPEASDLLKEDLKPKINKIKVSVTSTITQNEFDALMLFIFNIGDNGFETSSALKIINDPLAQTGYTSLEDAWKAWNKSQGNIMQGLINRRESEWKVFTKDVYEIWW